MKRAVRRLLVVGLLAILLAACGPSSASVPPGTGIHGTVTLGPTCPVEKVGEPPCVTPYAAKLVVTSADDGSVVARVTSGPDGTFTVDVPPGDYVIVPEPGSDGFPSASRSTSASRRVLHAGRSQLRLGDPLSGLSRAVVAIGRSAVD